MNLAEFIVSSSPYMEKGWPQRAYLDEPGFAELYVRNTFHFLDGEMRHCIDLANIEAEQPGRGTFKALVRRLRAEHPELIIYVECVLNPRFPPGLLRMGFVPVPERPDCYYLSTSVRLLDSFTDPNGQKNAESDRSEDGE